MHSDNVPTYSHVTAIIQQRQMQYRQYSEVAITTDVLTQLSYKLQKLKSCHVIMSVYMA